MITLLAIAVGCISIIFTGGFIADSIQQASEAYIRSRIGHLRIYQQGYLQNGQLKPFDYMIPMSEKLSSEIRSLPHVNSIGPRLSFAGLLSTGEATVSCIIEGIDPGVEKEMEKSTNLESGEFLKAEDAYQALLGKGLAKTLNSSVGSPLVLVTNTARGALNAADVNVRGVFASADKGFDDHGLRIPLRTAQKLLKTDHVQMILVFLDETHHTDIVRKALLDHIRQNALPYEVKAWYELEEADYVLKAMRFYDRIFWVLKIIIFLVVILSIMNTMNMAVLERIGEIGTLMAIGTRRKSVMTIFVLEGLFLGLLGGIIGCVVGSILAVVISTIGIPMPSAPGSTVKWVARIALVPSVIGFSFLTAVLMSLVSSILPAMKATRHEIAEALRHNI